MSKTRIEAINRIVDRWERLMNVEASHQQMPKIISADISGGTLSLQRVIEMANAGHSAAAEALRQWILEVMDNGKFDAAPVQLRNYAIQSFQRPPVAYPPGRNPMDHWLRDIVIGALVQITSTHWHLPVTRNRASKRLSACSLVATALKRRGHPLTEWQIERIYGATSPDMRTMFGRIAQDPTVVDRLSADLKPI